MLACSRQSRPNSEQVIKLPPVPLVPFVDREEGFKDELKEWGIDHIAFGELEKAPVYAWIRDVEEAIFSFDGITADAEEIAFRTKDPPLIDILLAVARPDESNSAQGKKPLEASDPVLLGAD